MKPWLVRGLALAAAMVVFRLVQSVLINNFETSARLISFAMVGLYGLVALAWAWIDGRNDARAQSDPDRRGDLAMRWLLAGLVAGVLSGLVTWLVSMFYADVYAEGLLVEISTYAAFVTLLIFLPAAAGVAVGRALVDRRRPDEPRKRSGDDENTDTDVFAAVRDDHSRRSDDRESDNEGSDDRGSDDRGGDNPRGRDSASGDDDDTARVQAGQSADGPAR